MIAWDGSLLRAITKSATAGSAVVRTRLKAPRGLLAATPMSEQVGQKARVRRSGRIAPVLRVPIGFDRNPDEPSIAWKPSIESATTVCLPGVLEVVKRSWTFRGALYCGCTTRIDSRTGAPDPGMVDLRVPMTVE
jgi:hypothetical protein